MMESVNCVERLPCKVSRECSANHQKARKRHGSARGFTGSLVSLMPCSDPLPSVQETMDVCNSLVVGTPRKCMYIPIFSVTGCFYSPQTSGVLLVPLVDVECHQRGDREQTTV